MSREVRMVPENWEHPKNEEGNFIALYGRSYRQADKKWMEGWNMWQQGLRRDFSDDDKWIAVEDEYKNMRYTEYDGARPNPDDYMPDWDESEKTHLMMYEDTSEGTPISPAFKTAEELARWLADNNASAFGRNTATYEQWLAMCQQGSCVSMVVTNGYIQSGVEFSANKP